MKTSRLSILAVTSLLALTTGCGGNKEAPKKGDHVINEATEILIWTTYNDSYQTVLNNAIEEFKTIEPNVTVKNIKQTGGYPDLAKMVTDGFAVDNYPDMVAAYPDAASDFILNFKGLDMTPYMTDKEIGWSQADLDDIPENYISLGQHYVLPGTYSLPASKSTEAMYYNQDKLIGVDLSAIDATINGGKPLNDSYLQNLTWEELMDKLIPALDEYNNGLIASGKTPLIDKSNSKWAWLGYDSDDNLFITLAEQYGYGYTDIDQVTGNGKIIFNNDNMKNLMKKFRTYKDKHYLCTQGTINDRPNNIFKNDQIMFSVGSTGGVSYQFNENNKHNIGVALIPQPAGGAKKVISQGPDFAFLDHGNENRAKATWLFFKLFTSTKYNTDWALGTGYSPIRYSVMETEDYLDYSDAESKDPKTLERLTALNARYAGSVSDYLFTSAVFKGSSEARTQVGSLMTACLTNADLDANIDSLFNTAVDNIRQKM